MIFVTVGTHLPFERLTQAASAIAAETGERVVVQGEEGPAGDHVEHVGLLEFEELVRIVREARVVVTHAGVGSILTCLRNGCSPIVVPRRAQFGEAADDHQVAFSRRLAGTGLVTLVEDPAQLGAAISTQRTAASRPEPSSGLVAELGDYLRANVRR